MKRRRLLLAALAWPSLLRAQDGVARWRAELDSLLRKDRRAPVPAGAVLFVGSSTIRFWNGLESAFGEAAPLVLKRGVGGSRLSDWPDLAPWLVWPYLPRQVIVYAGENDIAEGAHPAEVLEAFQRFVRVVREGLPGVPIAFVSLKPSPLRQAQMAAMREANLLVQTWVLGQEAGAALDYIELHAAMLDADGRPRPGLYARDGLHLSAEGYALWRQVISAHLKP